MLSRSRTTAPGLLLVALLSLVAARGRAQSLQSTGHVRNVVLIVTDGMRWQDVFRGADSTLMNKQFGHVEDSVALRREFWRPTIAARREALMPFLWTKIARQGQIYGDRDSMSIAQVTNGLKFSYPGYNEMIAGHADPRINSNSAPPNPNMTVFEWLNNLPAYHDSVAVFGTWDAFDRIFNRERSGLHIRAGWEQPFTGSATPSEIQLDELYATTTRTWSDLAYDSFLNATVLDYAREHRPRVMFAGYGETDEWAHSGRYDQYLRSAHRVDQFVRTLWDSLQAIPSYKDQTTFIITTDHGRGGGTTDWTDHGKDVAGAENIWIAALGPDTPPSGERKHSTPVTQSQIAATIAALLNEDYRKAVPAAAPPLADVVHGAEVRVNTTAALRQPGHDFRIADGSFLLDGRPFQIISGEMHYARIPREYWRHRLRMARAMGLNTISTYVFWNDHEVRPGVFDFHTGNRDLAEFIRMAQQEGLWVILRPGPYVCAEWEFGGLPSYLLKMRDLQVRSSDPRYLAAANRYVRALAKEIRPLLVTHGGPILMVQVENEYGSFGSDSAYKEATRRMLVDAGMDAPLFTADGDELFAKGGIQGVFPTANGETNYDTLVARVDRFHGGKGPYMVAEFYPGWLMHWAEPFPATPTDSFLPAYRELLRRGASVNLYMFHGGTNFGFTSGANYSKQYPIQPSTTSYDYDAPLSEAGWPTPKYYALRDVIRSQVSYAIPDVPDSLPVISIPPIQLAATGDLFDLTARVTPAHSAQPLSFEDLDQANGFVLYRHHFESAASGTLEVPGLRDYAVVLVDGRRVAVLDRRTRVFSAPVNVPAGGRLDILVENMGRINYGADMVHNRKGIIQPVKLAGTELSGWEMYRLPLDHAPTLEYGTVHRRDTSAGGQGVPVVYRGSFALQRTGDTFLDMHEWEKGVVFVNGITLGRYWNVGPQQTLYLPGAWLRNGRNEIVVLDMGGHAASARIAGLTTPILNHLTLVNSHR